ncbi:serine/threonine protein kinase [Purpureocillium lavendulum]|uniref:Serine/threonine protein kinase n=1 Tax=Purpureocillium lavendulum TaxID=1247861 RepID=A0AB34FH96_9HYPO|nr:serine/threonine protein kinase [Purpureocillium lavendulum]
MNAQISFLEGTYTLIHIPLNLYSSLLQPILRVLLPQTQSLDALRDDPAAALEGLTIDNQHGFLNISVTPIECSIVCHSSWAKNVFEPVIGALPSEQAKTVTVFKDTYMVLSVISAGLEAAGRVMELSSPLALAGIPIFFITTYYSDFILVPSKARHSVIKALSERGFELSENQSNFVNSYAYGRKNSASSSGSPPSTPPPSDAKELQTRTFDLMQRRNVSPYVDHGLQLVQCSGREISQLADVYGHRLSVGRQSQAPGRRNSWIENVDAKLYTCIISALVSKPRFLSLTLAQDDPPSLLLDRKLLPIFGDSIVGDTDSNFVPVFLDLVNLPSEVTGIVCGVAGRLVEDMHLTETFELSYLSTARAGAVILTEEQSTRALAILEPLLKTETGDA